MGFAFALVVARGADALGDHRPAAFAAGAPAVDFLCDLAATPRHAVRFRRRLPAARAATIILPDPQIPIPMTASNGVCESGNNTRFDWDRFLLCHRSRRIQRRG